MRIIFSVVILLFMRNVGTGVVITIPDDYPTIQQGIDASSDTDTVLVLPGTYYENINFNGHNIVLGSLFLTTGNTTYISHTKIDGRSLIAFTPLVSFSSGEDSTAIITGFAIQNSYSMDCVGGIYCDSSSPSIRNNIIRDNNVLIYPAAIQCGNYSNPIISNNIIIDNSSTMSNISGGINCSGNSDPVIIENTISGNYGDFGGGISCFGNSNPRIINNIISENSTAMFGGGISCYGSNAVINGNEIINNTADYYGGGIYCNGPNQVIIGNNRITENHARARGGGIYIQAIDPLIINNVFYRNIADTTGGGLSCWGSDPRLINNIFRADSIGWPSPIEANEISLENGSPVIEYCNIQGGWPGTGNIDVDPSFRNPASGNFHLVSIACGGNLDSPCIDAGSPYYSDSLLDCSWGLGTSASDMGAYGGADTAYVGVFEEVPSAPNRFMLLRAYPNPFNAHTTIEYSLAAPGDAELTIYDVTGAKVETIQQPGLEAGSHTVVWDAPEAASGVYFARLEAGGESRNIKMVLLK